MHMHKAIIHTAVGVAAAVAVATVAAGCGGTSQPGGQPGAQPTTTVSDTGSPTGTEEHNQADVTFAQNMIPHHQQAVEMSELAESRASDPQVKNLAGKIKAAQAPEIEQMTTWLNDWGEPVPSTSTAGHGMHGGTHRASPSAEMPGMMTDQDMAALEQASGNEFEKMFLEMMIRHHQGAVQMADTEIDEGQNPGAKGLAEKIKADQNAEIAQMQNLLKGK
jgi:uncharacterized protein (DUF305 family)